MQGVLAEGGAMGWGDCREGGERGRGELEEAGRELGGRAPGAGPTQLEGALWLHCPWASAVLGSVVWEPRAPWCCYCPTECSQ